MGGQRKTVKGSGVPRNGSERRRRKKKRRRRNGAPDGVGKVGVSDVVGRCGGGGGVGGWLELDGREQPGELAVGEFDLAKSAAGITYIHS